MNRLLADALGFFNVLLAIIIIVAGGIAGSGQAPGIGTVAGAIVGLVVAALICGTIAYVSLIEHHLRQISRSLRGKPSTEATVRSEPTL